MIEDTIWSLANLSAPPDRIMCGDGELTENHSEWVQDSLFWSIYYYHHANAVTYGTRTYAVQPGDIVFFSPGTVGAHALTGVGTRFDFMSFDLPSVSGVRGAIPQIKREMQLCLPQFRKASSRIVDTRAPAVAFVWNLLWTVAQSPSLFRQSEVLYVAEDFILRNLGRKFTVEEVAEAALVSTRTLLKTFREQHGVSVQEFILRKRVQEASRLLLKTGLPIKDISIRVGMSDLQYFNKTMRSMTGLAPSKLRAREKQMSSGEANS